MSMVTVAMVVLPITPTPAAIPPPRHVSLFEFSASTPPQTSPKSSWFSPNNGRAGVVGVGGRNPRSPTRSDVGGRGQRTLHGRAVGPHPHRDALPSLGADG